MRRVLAFLLVVSLLVSLAGCSNLLPDGLSEKLEGLFGNEDPTGQTKPWWDDDDPWQEGPSGDSGLCIADQPKPAPDPLDIPADLVSVLDRALILRPDCCFAFLQGKRTALAGPTPIQMEGILMVPALFTLESLGGKVTKALSEAGSCTILWGDTELVLEKGSQTAICNGKSKNLSTAVVSQEGDLLVAIADLQALLGLTYICRDDLIFIGPDVAQIAQATGDSAALIFSALDAELQNDFEVAASLGAIDQSAGYLDRSLRAESLVLTADMIPYTSKNGETVAVAGSLYVEDLKVEGSGTSDDYYTCTMTVYNTGYTYGSIEAYDKDDNLIEFERIKPFDGQKASVSKAFTDVIVLGEDIVQAIGDKSLAHLDYRSSLNASSSQIRLEVPADGYIFITCNPNHSQQVSIYNAIHAFVTVTSLAQDLISSDDGGMKQVLTDSLVQQVLEDATLVGELATEFANLFAGMDATPWKPADFAQEMSQKLLTMFSRCDFDIGKAMVTCAGKLSQSAADKAAEAYLTKLIPAMEVAFTSWKFSASSSNLICLFMDLQYCTNTRSVIIEVGDWRTAYAKLLRQRPASGDQRFMLGYINGDGIPDLMVFTCSMSHYGNSVEIFTYQNRQVKPILDHNGSSVLGIAYGVFFYAELQSVMKRGNMNMGISSVNYMHIQDNRIQHTDVLYDNTATGQAPEFYYNDEQVGKVYYYWKLNSLESKYEDTMQRVEGYDGHPVNDESIKAVLKR